MIYTTLKANREANIDIAIYCDDTIAPVGELFDESGKYMDKHDYTDWDKLLEDYTDRQIQSRALKYLKEYAKEDDSILVKHGKYLIDVELGYDEIEIILKEGMFKLTVKDLRSIERKANKRGYKLTKEVPRDEYTYTWKDLNDLIDEYLPCYADVNDTYCNDCGNCGE